MKNPRVHPGSVKSTDTPKRRYRVVPNQREAEITIRQAIRELVQLNEDHPFSYDREELIRMLDEACLESDRISHRLDRVRKR